MTTTRTLLWATDVHLDHLPHPNAARVFGTSLRHDHPGSDGLVVTGDIGEADCVEGILRDLVGGYGLPVYFVTGNHDYYGGSFRQVDRALARTVSETERLVWLRERPFALAPGTALVGTDGWYDARHGDRDTDLQLTDFTRIAELFEAQDESRDALLDAVAAHADEHARALDTHFSALLAEEPAPRAVIVATHVPPFREAAWYDNQPSDDRWAPFFSSKATGDVLMAHANAHPSTSFTVLCGHTHHPGVFRARDNLVVHTGRARYGAPELAGVVRIDGANVEVQPFEP